MRLWVRAKLGGERMTDLAREFGYRDGSGALQVVKRLEARAGTDKTVARQMRQLRRHLTCPCQVCSVDPEWLRPEWLRTRAATGTLTAVLGSKPV